MDELPETIKVAQLSPLFRARGRRSGLFEILCGIMLAILSNIVIFGTDASDPLGQPILLVWAVCTVLVGVISILAGINGWRGFPPFVSFETNSVILMFFWTIGTTVLVIVIGALSLTRFLSLGCKLVSINVLCGEAGLIATLITTIFIYVASKAVVFYCAIMMRREIDHTVAVVEDNSQPRHASMSSSNHPTDPTRTYGSTDNLHTAVVGGTSSTGVTLDEFEEDSKLSSSTVLGPRLYMNESQRELYETGLRKFNAKPKRGIDFILSPEFMELLLNVRAKVTSKLSSSSETKPSASKPATDSGEVSLTYEQADAIAIMLSDHKVISPIKLGSYLGQSDATATAIRRAWVARMDFTGMDFDKALRRYLTQLILPPETEKIDRLIESFARHYHECNPTIFSCSDTAYVLAFGLLMLHTDAHNPNMKKEAKMTKDQFLRNMRGIDSGADLPTTYMSGLYDRIVAEEMMTDVARKGYLWKHARPGRGGIGQEWQKRYFVLSSDRVLYYYLSHTDKNPRAIIPLEGLEVLKVEHESRPFCFLIRDPHRPTVKAAKRRDDGSLENATHENFLLSGESDAEQNGWIKSLRMNIDKNPFYTLIKTKVSALDFGGGNSGSPPAISLVKPTPVIQTATSTASTISSTSATSLSNLHSSSPAKKRASVDVPRTKRSTSTDEQRTVEGIEDDEISLEQSIIFEDDSDNSEIGLDAVDDTARLSLALGAEPPRKRSDSIGVTTSPTNNMFSPTSPSKSTKGQRLSSPAKVLQQSTDVLLKGADVSSDSEEETLESIGL